MYTNRNNNIESIIYTNKNFFPELAVHLEKADIQHFFQERGAVLKDLNKALMRHLLYQYNVILGIQAQEV